MARINGVWDWDQVSKEVPSAESDSFIQQVLRGRQDLMAQEKTQRADAAFRASLSPIAQRACAIVDRIRLEEKDAVWTPQVEEDLAESTGECVFPGMMFMLAKDRMESTRLWKIVRRMPKGSLLHAHMDAMVEFDYLIRELLKLPGVHMSSDRPLATAAAREDAALSFRYRAVEVTGGPSVRDEAYVPGNFILLTKVADEWPEGGREGFITWLKARCTLSVTDSHEHHHGIDAIWVKFARCFVIVATLIHYEPMFRILLRRMMSSLKADGVNWAELR
jgi:adenosine deaminase CECR1